MSLIEYLGEWIKVMDKGELYRLMERLNSLYLNQMISPNKKQVFKALPCVPTRIQG